MVSVETKRNRQTYSEVTQGCLQLSDNQLALLPELQESKTPVTRFLIFIKTQNQPTRMSEKKATSTISTEDANAFKVWHFVQNLMAWTLFCFSSSFLTSLCFHLLFRNSLLINMLTK
jgi:hypothetical protein